MALAEGLHALLGRRQLVDAAEGGEVFCGGGPPSVKGVVWSRSLLVAGMLRSGKMQEGRGFRRFRFGWW